MRIAITSRQYLPVLGGTIQYTSMLASEFSRQGHAVKLITRTPERHPSDRETPFELIRCPSQNTLMASADWADVVLQVEPSLQDVWPFLIKRKPWFPTLHVGHSTHDLSRKDALLRAIQRFSLRFGRPIGVSQYVLNSWGSRGVSILNPVDSTIFEPPPDNVRRDVDVLFVGRMTHDKGVGVLMDALVRLVKEKLVSHAVFVGDGPACPGLAARISETGLSTTVQLVGRADAAGVAAWMQRSRVLAFPTTPAWLEAAGLTLLEALACGCEVVASDIGGVAETGGGFIRLVKPGNVDELYDGLRKTLMGESARNAEVDEYLKQQTLPEVARRYLQLMKSAVNGSSRPEKRSKV